MDLTGLEVGRPSLEDAYLALTSEEDNKINHTKVTATPGTMIGRQVRYQATLMLRNPRTRVMACLILPGALLALQVGRVQHLGQGAPPRTSLAARAAGPTCSAR